MKTASIVFLALAALTLLRAIKQSTLVILASTMNTATLVGYVIGSFLPSFVLGLIGAGCWLSAVKPNNKTPQNPSA